MDEVLHGEGGNRVQCGTRLVHEQYLWLHGDSAGDAQTLLLTTGEAAAWLVQTVLNLVPQVGAAQGLLRDFLKLLLVLFTGQLQACHYVVLDGHRGERVSLLEDHADGVAYGYRVDLRSVNIGAIEQDFALHGGAGDDLVHAVDGAQHGGLTTAGRADECGHGLGRDLHIHVLHGVEVAVKNVHVIERELRHLGVSPLASVWRNRVGTAFTS